MVDQISADCAVTACFDCNFDLRTYTVGARYEDRLVEAGRDAEHSAKTTETSDYAFRERRLDKCSDAILGRVRSIDIDSGASVAKRVAAHAGISSSNAPGRRMSRMR